MNHSGLALWQARQSRLQPFRGGSAARGGIVERSEAGDEAHGMERDFPVVVATMPINAWQRNAALGAVALLFVGAAIEAPFAHIQAARVDAFIPVVQTV